MNTLLEPYYEMMIGNAMRNFTQIVWSGEYIERGIKNKKIERKSTLASFAKKNTPPKKKEGDTLCYFHQSAIYGVITLC